MALRYHKDGSIVRTCAVCRTKPESETETIWVYSQRLGYELQVPVCDDCLQRFKHAAYIAEQIIVKFDKCGGSLPFTDYEEKGC